MSGKWLVIEGMEGAGKTTLRNGLSEYINKEFPDKSIVYVREPGGTPLAEKLRDLAKYGIDGEVTHPTTELLLFFAARIQLIENVVKPALARGAVVISDRNYISSVMYQGYGNGQLAKVNALIDLTLMDGPQPDLYFYLDIDLTTSANRVDSRGEKDAIEQRAREFFGRVLVGYRDWALDNPETVLTLDATQSIENIRNRAVTRLHPLLTA